MYANTNTKGGDKSKQIVRKMTRVTVLILVYCTSSCHSVLAYKASLNYFLCSWSYDPEIVCQMHRYTCPRTDAHLPFLYSSHLSAEREKSTNMGHRFWYQMQLHVLISCRFSYKIWNILLCMIANTLTQNLNKHFFCHANVQTNRSTTRMTDKHNFSVTLW